MQTSREEEPGKSSFGGACPTGCSREFSGIGNLKRHFLRRQNLLCPRVAADRRGRHRYRYLSHNLYTHGFLTTTTMGQDEVRREALGLGTAGRPVMRQMMACAPRIDLQRVLLTSKPTQGVGETTSRTDEGRVNHMAAHVQDESAMLQVVRDGAHIATNEGVVPLFPASASGPVPATRAVWSSRCAGALRFATMPLNRWGERGWERARRTRPIGSPLLASCRQYNNRAWPGPGRGLSPVQFFPSLLHGTSITHARAHIGSPHTTQCGGNPARAPGFAGGCPKCNACMHAGLDMEFRKKKTEPT